MKKNYSVGIFNFNSPVILGMTGLSLLLLLLNTLSGGLVNQLFGVRHTSWGDPMMYLRLFTYPLLHANFEHFINNYLLILVVGPIAEEKYGWRTLLAMFAITSVATGLINVIFFKNVMLVGASGLVFMLVLLASFTNMQQGTIPVTVLLVALLYIGNEVVVGVFENDNISQMGHIVGGVCGAALGFIHTPKKRTDKNRTGL